MAVKTIVKVMAIVMAITLAIVLAALTSSMTAKADVVINEVMYNPIGNDNNQEFVEIFYDNFVNMSGWIIGDLSSNDTLTMLKFVDSPYCLIVEQESNLSNINATIYSAGSAIGNALNNDEDEIFLYNNKSELVDYFHYNKSMGGDGDGNSLQYCYSLSSWIANKPTAGYENNCTLPPEPTINALYPLYVIKNTIFVVFVNASNIDKLKDVKISITKQNDTSTINRVWNENDNKWSSGYYYLDDQMLPKSFYVKVDDFTGQAIINVKTRDKILYSSSRIFVVDSVNDINMENSTNDEMSDIGIISITDKSKDSMLRVKIYAYRNDTRKYAVYVYAKKDDKTVSEKTTAYIHTKFINQTLSLPVMLKNCENGNYTIVVEGLGLEKERELSLGGCKNQEDTNKAETSSSDECISASTSGNDVDVSITSSIIKPDKSGSFDIAIDIFNNEDKQKYASIYGYLYKGSKCYSCVNGLTKESNKVNVKLEPNSIKTVTLPNIAKAESGNYKYKVVVDDMDGGRKHVYTYVVTVMNNNKDNIFRLAYETKTEELIQSKAILISIIVILLIIIMFKKAF